MKKTFKSLASLFVVMAMVISMIPTSFIITASATTFPATYSLKKTSGGDGPDIFTNWSNEYNGKYLDSAQTYQAGYQNNDNASTRDDPTFESGAYTFTLYVALSDENATRDMPELYIADTKVGQFTQAQITQAMRDNHSSLPEGYAYESGYFTYMTSLTVTPGSGNKDVKLIFKHNDKDKVGFKQLVISSGGASTDTDTSTATDTATDTSTDTSTDTNAEVLITTLDSGSDDWNWTVHTLGTYDFAGYENIRFEARSKSGEFNKIGTNSSNLHYFGNKTSLDGTFDGTDGNVNNEDVTNSSATFYWEGNGRIEIKFYGTPMAPSNYTVTFSGTNGTVAATAGGSPISSGAEVAGGTSVTFTATPSSGYAFMGWSDGSLDNPRTVTVRANTTMTATFGTVSYPQTVNAIVSSAINPGFKILYGDTNKYTVDGNFINCTSGLNDQTRGGLPFYIDDTSAGVTYTISVYVEGNNNTYASILKPNASEVTGGRLISNNNWSDLETGPEVFTLTGDQFDSVGWYYAGFYVTNNNAYINLLKVVVEKSGGTQSYTVTFSGTNGTVTATAGGNAISSGDSVEDGTSVTLTATPATGYSFTRWDINDGSSTTTDTDNPLTYTVESNVIITPVFTANNYTITVAADPVAGGNVSGGGSYSYGQNANLSATTNTGYIFDGWYLNDSKVSSSANYTPTVTGAATYTAKFIATTTITLTSADYKDAYNFYYEDGGNRYAVPFDFTTGIADVTVNVTSGSGYLNVFGPSGMDITNMDAVIDNSKGGTITSSLAPRQGYANGKTSFVIKSTSASGRYYVAMSNNTDITITVTYADGSVATLPVYTVTIGSASNGSATVNSAASVKVKPETAVTLSATPDANYTFDHWNIVGATVNTTSTSNSYTPTESVTITPVFVANAPIQYTITGASNGNGTVSGTATVNAGTSVTLTATPDSGYHFVKWDDENTDNPRTVIANADAIYTATFEEDTPDTDTSTKYQFESGSSTSFAHVKDNIDFDQLKPTTYDGAVIATGINESGIQSTVLHNFPTAGTYRISLVYYGNNDGGHEYTLPSVKVGDHAAVPFGTASWTKDEGGPAWRGPFTVYVDYVITTPGVQTVLVTGYPGAGEKLGYDYLEIEGGSQGSEEVTQYTVTVPAVTGGSVLGAGTYNENTPVTLYAYPDSGYIFKRWTVGGDTVSTSSPYSFTLTGNVTVTPVFARAYTITVNAGANGSVTGGGTYEEGSTVTITATADRGYKFSAWNDSNTSNPRTITVSGNATYTATFEASTGATDTIRIEGEGMDFQNAVEIEEVEGASQGAVAYIRSSNDSNMASYTFTAPANTDYTFKFVSRSNAGDGDRKVQYFVKEVGANSNIYTQDVTVHNDSWLTTTSSAISLEAGKTYQVAAIASKSWNWDWEWIYFDYLEISAPTAVFTTDHTVTASAEGDEGATIGLSGSTSGTGVSPKVFHEGESVTINVTPTSTHKVAYWTINGVRDYSTSTSYTIDYLEADTTVVVTLVQSIDLQGVIKAADSDHPYAYAEVSIPNTLAFASVYDNSNWEDGFDIVFSYSLEDASGNPITFYGSATASFIVEGASGNVYAKSQDGVENDEAAAISNCWYMGNDTVSDVRLLLTELRYTNYNNGEYGDLDIGKKVNFHILSITHRDTPYVDLTNKTSNYIIYGNEIPVTNLGIDGWNNGNGSSTIDFQTVVDSTNEFNNHRVWQIIYHLDTSSVDNETGGINDVYVGRYYIVPDGDVAVDATGGSGFSFYYRTAENQTQGTWITMQSNLFTTHGANVDNLEPMKVYLEPTYGEWKAYYATYDLSRAAGKDITYWDFFIDGGDPCTEVAGGYLFDQNSTNWIHSATDATFWFTELRLERYKTVTLTYKDQFGKIIETREVRLGSIQAPSTLTDREGYLFTYWTLDGEIVGPYWYYGTEGEWDSGSLAIPNADGAYCYDDGHFNAPVTAARTYVAHYVYNGNLFNVTSTNGTITTTNTKTGETTAATNEGTYDYEMSIKLTANKDTAEDFMYWSYAEYRVNTKTGLPVDINGEDFQWDDEDFESKKVYKHFAILSYEPTVTTNVMGHTDYFAIYADDIADGAVGVVSPILAYYTPNKTGNGTGKVYRSTNTSTGTDEIYAYASMFSRAVVFDTYHDSEYNKLSFISTIAYDKDLYNPIGFGAVVTGYKQSAQSILNADSDALLAKTGSATTSDEMAITYENFLSATTHFYTSTTPQRSIQEVDFRRDDALKSALTSGQFLTSLTGLDNQTRRYARTFLIVEEISSGAVYVVYSDTYANAAIGSVPTQYTISADIKVGADTSTAPSVPTTTEGHTTTATVSGNHVTGVGSISSGMSGILRAVAEVGFEFAGWDTDNDGEIDETTPLLHYADLSGNLSYTAYFVPVTTVYVTATVATTNGGTIASSIQNGQVNKDTTVYLYAMPNDGYTFLGWVKSSSELGISYVPETYTSTDASYSFTASNARTYVYAYFRANTDGKATVRPIIGSVNGGTATVNNRSYVSVVPDTTVTLKATPKLGYSFVNWTIGGVEVSTNATFSYTVTSTDDVVITANFAAVEGLTDTKTLQAENYTAAKYNYVTSSVTASENALTTDTDSDVTYTILTYDDGDGEIDENNGDKIVQLLPFTAPVSGTYDFKVYYKKTNENSDIYIDVFNTDSETSYSTVTIDGTTYHETWYYGSYNGYTNNNTTWGANSYDVRLTLAANEKILIGLCDNNGLGAQFDKVVVTSLSGNVFSTSDEPAQATITFATIGGGTIYNTIDPDDTTTVLTGAVDYNIGARVGMHAVPDAGKEFVGWSLDGETTFTNENVTKDTLYTHRVASDATIYALFRTYTNLNHSHQALSEPYYTATITVENGNSATVKSYWASNSEGYYIDTVTGSNVTMSVPTRKITMTAVDKEDDGTTNVFAGWYQDGVFKTSERTFKTDFISGNTTIVAKYLIAEDLQTVTANIVGGAGSGSVTANKEVFTSGSFAEGASQKFTAEANLGYVFAGWSTNGTDTPVLTGTIGNGTIEKEAKLNLTVGSSDETFYAHFVPYTTQAGSHTHDAEETYYNVTASVNNGNTVVVQNYWSSTSEGYYLDSTTSSMTITVPNRKLTLSAIDKVAGEGEINVFAGWYVNGSFLGMGEGANHEIKTAAKISSATTIEARYTTALEIKAAVNYYGAATITDGSTTASEITISSPVNGTTYTFTAGTPNNYYAFDGWYNGDTKVASTNEYSYTYATADGSVNLVAKYNYLSADTMPIISIVTSDYATTNADSTQTSGFTAITKDYKSATVNVLNGSDYNNYSLVDATAKVKGRGNSTWNTSTTYGLKRAIRFKFDSKQNLLNINKNGTSKSWVLLANNLDRSLLRNSLAFELGDRLTNILYSSKYASVEVYINGVYQGVYLLCEQSEADATRVNITEPADDVATEIEAFIELDNVQNFTNDSLYDSDTIGTTYDGDYYFQIDDTNWTTYQTHAFVIKSDVNSQAQYNYLSTLFTNAQTAIYGGNQASVGTYIDVDSFVDMYILQEIAKNTDVGYSSFYFAVKNGKIYCTTPWDFDKAFGNDERGDNTSGLYVGEGTQNNTETSLNTNPWFIALMDTDWFLAAVKDRWTDLYEDDVFDDVLSVIASDYTRYSASYGRNWSKWSSKIANGSTQLDNEPSSYMSFASSQAAYNQLVSWYTARITYLNSVFNTSVPVGTTTYTFNAIQNDAIAATLIDGTAGRVDGSIINNDGAYTKYGLPFAFTGLQSGDSVVIKVYAKAQDGGYAIIWDNSYEEVTATTINGTWADLNSDPAIFNLTGASFSNNTLYYAGAKSDSYFNFAKVEIIVPSTVTVSASLS